MQRKRKMSMPRRWSTALASAVMVAGVLTPSATAATPSADTGNTTGTTGSAPTKSSSDEPALPKVLGLEPGQTPDPNAVPAPTPSDAIPIEVVESSQKAGSSTSAVGGATAIPACTPRTHSDLPHISANRLDVSAHAWWFKGSCSNDTATVTARLYEYYDDGTWRAKQTARNGDQSPGRGSGKWLNVRKRCQGDAWTGWAVWVDVDVNWEVDTGETSWRADNLNCRVT